MWWVNVRDEGLIKHIWIAKRKKDLPYGGKGPGCLMRGSLGIWGLPQTPENKKLILDEANYHPHGFKGSPTYKEVIIERCKLRLPGDQPEVYNDPLGGWIPDQNLRFGGLIEFLIRKDTQNEMLQHSACAGMTEGSMDNRAYQQGALCEKQH